MTPRREEEQPGPGLCGVLNLDKPAGWTSHDAVQKARRLLGTKRIGHAGTLDPLATGVLPLLVGGATRFAEFLTHLDKEYEVVCRFGLSTDTQDVEGTVLATSSHQPPPEEVERGLLAFLGEGLQIPPMYSAIRMNGKRMYELAREGKTVEREARRIQVDRISDIQYEYPLLSFRIAVSAGTYVRTICHDLGERLGCGAAMASLRRSKVGPFSLQGVVSLAALELQSETERGMALWKLEDVFSFLPAVRVDQQGEVRVAHGQALVQHEPAGGVEGLEEGQNVCILSNEGRMLAMGKVRISDGQLLIAPIRVLANGSVASSLEQREFSILASKR